MIQEIRSHLRKISQRLKISRFYPQIHKLVFELINKEIMKKDYSKLFITTENSGGLGNQLFQIANVLAYAWKYSLTPIFKKISISKYPNSVMGNKVYPRYVYWNNFFMNLYQVKRLPSKLVGFKEKDMSYHKIPNPETILNLKKLPLRKIKGIIFHGFYGSGKYFDKYRKKILSSISYIDPSEKDYLKKKYVDFFDENIVTVALHVRRGDIKPHLWPDLTETDYNQKSISFFVEKFSKHELKFIIFSNDTEWTKNYMKINFPKLNLIFPIEKDYLELYLMSCCNHQIIANSTFSWWAAYLNNFPDKIVIAPKNWFGPKAPRHWFGPKGIKNHDLYMDDWILL